MPMLQTDASLEFEDLAQEFAPMFLYGLLDENEIEVELDLDIDFTYGTPETRTDPADPGELYFSIHTRETPRREIQEHWITHSAWEALNSIANKAVQLKEEGEARGDFLYEQSKGRR